VEVERGVAQEAIWPANAIDKTSCLIRGATMTLRIVLLTRGSAHTSRVLTHLNVRPMLILSSNLAAESSAFSGGKR
jgi:hypothetical protein